jgi:transcriptional regulator with XRE-family HTH domain
MEMGHRERAADGDRARAPRSKLSNIVGDNLRRLRRAQGLSLEQLSQIAGVSRAMLGQIETGKSAPTINLLGRVADALGVSVPSLISAQDTTEIVIVPRDRSTVLSTIDGGFSSRALFPWGDASAPEVYEFTIAAAHTEPFVAGPAGLKKTVVVIAGCLEVTVGDDHPVKLWEGDTVLFAADTAHRFHNASGEDAKAFLVVTGLSKVNVLARSS